MDRECIIIVFKIKPSNVSAPGKIFETENFPS